jgi:sec-independent protein translocase protein TatA
VLNVGTPELLLILLVGLLVLGPTKLPEAARQVGKAMAEMRRIGAGFQAEMRDAMQEPVQQPPVEPEPDGDAPA